MPNFLDQSGPTAVRQRQTRCDVHFRQHVQQHLNPNFSDLSSLSKNITPLVLHLEIVAQVQHNTHRQHTRYPGDNPPRHDIPWLVLFLEQVRREDISETVTDVI